MTNGRSEIRVGRARIRINGAFRGQVVTGQQRYATEVSAEMVRLAERSVSERLPGLTVQRSRLLSWLWAILQWPISRRRDYMVTFTSRGPILARNHVVVVHDLFVFDHPEWYSARYILTHRFIQAIQIKTARILVAVSEPTAERLRRLVGEHRRIIVAPNAPSGFVKEHAPELVGRILGEFGVQEHGFLLTVGSVEPRKNLTRILSAYEAAGVHETIPLLIVGGTSDIFRGESLAVPAGVRFVGRVDDEILGALYANAAATIFTPLDEGFGLPAVEALAAGTRLIASDIPVLRWVCGAEALFVDPTCPAEIARAMLRVVEEPQSITDRRRASEMVCERFSWAGSARTILEAIERDRLS